MSAIVSEAQLHDAVAPVAGVLAGAEVRLGLLEGTTLRFLGGTPPRDKAIWASIGRVLDHRSPADARVGNAGLVHVRAVEHGGDVLGVLLLQRSGPLSAVDRALAAAIAGHLAVALAAERTRERLEALLRRTMPDEVVRELARDSRLLSVGGAVRTISALFADLRGFTSYAERYPPEQVVAMLNRYFEVAVPVLINHGGTITAFIGDAIMAIFNAPVAQPEHATLAARAGLALQAAIAEEAAARPGWPLFRVGVHTGPALVGSIGTAQRSTYTAIGDTVNVAARLEGKARPGQVVISAASHALLAPGAAVEPLGPLAVKGRDQPVEAMVLHALATPAGAARQTTSLSISEVARLLAEHRGEHPSGPEPPG